MLCPDCGEQTATDYTPEYNEALPWEIVCFGCGWFHGDRFETEEAAEGMLK